MTLVVSLKVTPSWTTYRDKTRPLESFDLRKPNDLIIQLRYETKVYGFSEEFVPLRIIIPSPYVLER